ncbi:MAG TPA: glycosyltransferase family 2 protein, partial [Alphaproteobacteria bacterium]|nr:glycosyltransferase family 2 protein [Alphaproteobacteria bacterium]
MMTVLPLPAPTGPAEPGPAGPAADGPVLSVVLPVYNESGNLDALFARLAAIMGEIGLDWEAVCVDDGSRDDSFGRLVLHHRRDPRIKVVGLSRNFGKEVALTAGLAHARGRAVLLMDSDLQHPPELIRDMVRGWLEGDEVVYAQRVDRETDGPLRRLLTRGFYRAFARISEVPLPP